MKVPAVLENLQRIIESAETIISVIPDDACDNMWIQETIDNALGELEKTRFILKDKYDIDTSEIDHEEYLSDMDDEDLFANDDDLDNRDRFDDFKFGDDDDDDE